VTGMNLAEEARRKKFFSEPMSLLLHAALVMAIEDEEDSQSH